jgi:hypothetical protein
MGNIERLDTWKYLKCKYKGEKMSNKRLPEKKIENVKIMTWKNPIKVTRRGLCLLN